MIAQLDKLYIKIRPSKVINRLLSYALFEGRPLTTKGRWLNPLVFGLYEIEKALSQLKKVEKPIFILGTGRSGTTILGIVLSMHKDVGFLNEPKALWNSCYKEEDLIGSYSRGNAKYYLNAEDSTEQIKQNMHKIFGAYLTVTGSKRVVDKYPELIFRIPFVKAIFPDAKFIFLVRNGWDTCHSIDSWSKRLGTQKNGERHDWWGVNNRKWNLLIEQVVSKDSDLAPLLQQIKGFTRHTDMAAVEWIVTMREGLKAVADYPNNTYMLKYEDMVNTPKESLINLLSFCELPPDNEFMEYSINTLSPAPIKKSFELHPAILPLFKKTMKDLGYDYDI